MIHVFTSAAPNYLGKVKTLFYSIRRHHPEWVPHLVLVERERERLAQDLKFFDNVIFATDLDSGKDPGWLFTHSVVELSTALKGEVVLHLLKNEHADKVIYLDPDIVLFSRVDEIVKALDESSIVLTPHLLRPETDPEAILDNEICNLKYGIFNLGFLGVNNCPEGFRFAEWWNDRLNRFCRDDLAGGLFTDQKWLDFAPLFFDEVHIMRNSRFNVAPWNIGQRTVAGSFDEGFTVDKRPLGFYHFTGFDSGAHEAMIGKYAPQNRSVRMLIDWYKRRTRALSLSEDFEWSLGFYDNGEPIERAHRLLYRRRLDLKTAFPDPFSVSSVEPSYWAWLQTEGVKDLEE